MAMLVLLESLSPAERTAFVLHDVLKRALPGDRRRRRPLPNPLSTAREPRPSPHRGEVARFTVDATQQSAAVERVRHSLRRWAGRNPGRRLAPDVVLRSDGGGLVSGVARHTGRRGRQGRPTAPSRRCQAPRVPWSRRVNGAAGLVFEDSSGVVGVMGFTVADQQITEIDFVVNPEKLRRVVAPSLSFGEKK